MTTAKFFLLLALSSSISDVNAFSASLLHPSRTTSSTRLYSSTSLPPKNKNGNGGGIFQSLLTGDFANKPIPRKGERTTVPVAAREVSRAERQKMEDVMIEPNYFLAYAVALLCPLIIWYHPSYAEQGPSLIGICGGGFHLLFAMLLWVQTRRVRCVFEQDAFEFYNIKGPHLDLERGAWLERKPGNYVVGTPNRWKYDTIIHYGFFPSMEFPVICYFKETETPKEKWSRWFAAFDSYGNGQPHFFPGICDVYAFKEQMELRGVKRKPIPTKKNKNIPIQINKK